MPDTTDFPNVHVSSHPLIKASLTKMRCKDTSSADFRRALHEVTTLLAYEATADFPTRLASIETPICPTDQPVLDDVEIVIVPIIRAAVGMVDPLLELMPDAHVGFAGMQRDEQTHEPQQYYWKMPTGVQDMLVIVVDPMLATGGSAMATVDLLKENGCKHVRMMNIVGAPEGVAAMQGAHPDVPIYLAALDEHLNENAYIVPGLGDAGDRIYGTV